MLISASSCFILTWDPQTARPVSCSFMLYDYSVGLLQGGVVGGQAGPTGVACWEAYNSDTSKPHIQFWSLEV